VKIEAFCTECKQGVTASEVLPSWDRHDHLANCNKTRREVLRAMREAGCRHDFDLFEEEAGRQTEVKSFIAEVIFKQMDDDVVSHPRG
jgi:hypothetical protein